MKLLFILTLFAYANSMNDNFKNIGKGIPEQTPKVGAVVLDYPTMNLEHKQAQPAKLTSQELQNTSTETVRIGFIQSRQEIHFIKSNEYGNFYAMDTIGKLTTNNAEQQWYNELFEQDEIFKNTPHEASWSKSDRLLKEFEELLINQLQYTNTLQEMFQSELSKAKTSNDTKLIEELEQLMALNLATIEDLQIRFSQIIPIFAERLKNRKLSSAIELANKEIASANQELNDEISAQRAKIKNTPEKIDWRKAETLYKKIEELVKNQLKNTKIKQGIIESELSKAKTSNDTNLIEELEQLMAVNLAKIEDVQTNISKIPLIADRIEKERLNTEIKLLDKKIAITDKELSDEMLAQQSKLELTPHEVDWAKTETLVKKFEELLKRQLTYTQQRHRIIAYDLDQAKKTKNTESINATEQFMKFNWKKIQALKTHISTLIPQVRETIKQKKIANSVAHDIVNALLGLNLKTKH